MTVSAAERRLRLRRVDPVLAAAAVVVLVTLAARGGSVVREIVTAHAFGVGGSMDAFVLALTIPTFVAVLVTGAVGAAFVPVYARVRLDDGAAAASLLLGRTLAAATAIALALVAVLAAAAPALLKLVAGGFPAEKVALATRLTYALLPLVVLVTVTAILAAALNAHRRFALAAAVPALTPFVVVAALLGRGDEWGIYSLAVGVVAGAAAEAAICFALARRASLFGRFDVRGVLGDEHLRRVAAQYLPAVAGSLLMSASLLVDNAMASHLGSGSVATLNYANRLVTVVVAIGATAVGTVALTHFSDLAARERWDDVARGVRRYVLLSLAVGVPAAAALVLLSRPIVATVLEGGAFTSDATGEVATAQALLALQIPFYVGSIVVVRVLSAVRANGVLVWGSAISLVVNVAGNALLMQWLDVAGIALATSIVYAVSLVFLFAMLQRRLERLRSGR